MDRVHASFGTFRFPSRLFSGLLLISFLFLTPVKASGQTPSDRVHDFLESASGFNLLGTIHEGVLGSGQSLAIAVPLLEGADYMVVGYCNDACTNLDLVLLDSSGEEVQADRLPDSEPILTLTMESTGQYYIQVEAVECSIDGCDVAVGILGSTDEPGVGPGEDMAGRLTLVGADLLRLGFTELGGEKRGALNTDQAINFPVTLQEGWEYRMVGVCDKDCVDLDLALFDPIGNEVDSDFLEDALPVLAPVPDTTGEYQVEVIMVACGVEPCAYRVATFVKREDFGPGGTTFSGEMVLQETHRGVLDSEDDQLPPGTYLDLYQVEVRAGQRIVLDLGNRNGLEVVVQVQPGEPGGPEVRLRELLV